MGTNFYLRRKEPTVRQRIHIGKRSFGWMFHWDSCKDTDYPRWCDEPDVQPLPHSITCVEDIRAYLRTGDWELEDEYGDTYEDWEAEIDGFISWDGGKASHNRRNPDNLATWEPMRPSGYSDREGQTFDYGRGFI